ncbi:WD repeat, putative [Babesia ovata]|uniref:WD repeat, putative n=1 Tax=Babesia ovata TaxID=189622 RepID=A0A2H6KC23_9APIC|nr:WD repeat, putative [Babesia ovata]GBE60537.1 WD repeat, putative [Babesia ovata]
MASQRDERETEVPAGGDEKNPPKRICTGGNKDGEKDMQKTIELKRLEMSTRKNRELLNDFLAVMLSYRKWDLASPPEKSPSGTGSDGADDNRSANDSKDECPFS